MFKFLSLICAFTVASIAAAEAAQPQVLGEYGDWTAWTYNESGNLICYMSSTPKKDEGKYTKRGDIFVIITHRPAEKSFDEVSFMAGYTFKSGAPMTVKIGNKTFKNTFTEGDKAWMVSNAEDKSLIAEMKRGSRMIVDGTSSRGTATKDTYSLKGFTSAYNAITAKCKR
ncbi:MAG: hypothetical protein IJ738_02985 [Alphaproteobacteria bacterium]|nr:hypothetical protein [Alphaproteobacteria bacterium]